MEFDKFSSDIETENLSSFREPQGEMAAPPAASPPLVPLRSIIKILACVLLVLLCAVIGLTLGIGRHKAVADPAAAAAVAESAVYQLPTGQALAESEGCEVAG